MREIPKKMPQKPRPKDTSTFDVILTRFADPRLNAISTLKKDYKKRTFQTNPDFKNWVLPKIELKFRQREKK